MIGERFYKNIESFALISTDDFRIVIKCRNVGLVVINPLYTWGKNSEKLNCLHRWRGSESDHILRGIDYEINKDADIVCLIDGVDGL